ncbi:MAG: hypothetical protein KatS3mg101_1066 [Patescibacteria group bacterium]|nr:MAG: hypothetical protein KatS3mg101_1066 [Patescibacteria group bacterium]
MNWNSLPKWVRVIPYVAASGALTAIIDHLSHIQVNDAVLMAVINVLIVMLKEIKIPGGEKNERKTRRP